MKHGPNVQKLIIHKVSLLMVPVGSTALLQNVVSSIGKIGTLAQEAEAWVNQAIAAVKAAKDNPYGSDDEAIAAEILRQVRVKRGVCEKCGGSLYHTRLKGYRCSRCD